MTKPITEDQIATIRHLRHQCKSWDEISVHLRMSVSRVRGAVDPEFAFKQRILMQERRARKGGQQRYPTRAISAHDLQQATRLDIPREVLIDRDVRQMAAPRDLTAALMGDPPSPTWYKRND
jgi:hypothetical protein